MCKRVLHYEGGRTVCRYQLCRFAHSRDGLCKLTAAEPMTSSARRLLAQIRPNPARGAGWQSSLAVTKGCANEKKSHCSTGLI